MIPFGLPILSIGGIMLCMPRNHPYRRAAIVLVLCSAAIGQLPAMYDVFSKSGFVTMPSDLFMEIGVYVFLIIAIHSLPNVYRFIEVLMVLWEIYVLATWFVKYWQITTSTVTKDQCQRLRDEWEDSEAGSQIIRNNIIPLLYSDSTSPTAIRHCVRVLGPYLSLPQVHRIEDMDYRENGVLVLVYQACVVESLKTNTTIDNFVPCEAHLKYKIQVMRDLMSNWDFCRTTEESLEQCQDLQSFFAGFLETVGNKHPIDGMFLARLKGDIK